jgi:predicted nicotinamide N-methyase
MEMSEDEYDASDALFQRGDFLRKLRELEREDEAQRVRDVHECQENEDTLQYESYLSNQSYYDDYKHVNYKYIDFGPIGGDEPFVIEQDRTVGKGGFVWDSAFILAEHVVKTSQWPVDKAISVVDLGAGTGLCGLMVARSFPLTTKVHLTDLPQLQPLLEQNSKQAPNASFGVLEWGKSLSSEKYDVILGADVVASIYDSSALAKTLCDLANPETKVYLACRDRLAGSIERFEIQMKQMFAKVERRKTDSSNKNPDVWIFYASGRRSYQ